jgi:hypothetical protein
MKKDWHEVFNPDLKKSPKDLFDSLLVRILLPLASLLIGALGLTAKELPAWAIASLGFVLCVLLCVLAWPLISWAFVRLRNRATLARVSRQYFADLDQMARRLKEHVSDNYTNHLLYELRNLTGVQTKVGVTVVHDLSEFVRLSEWLALVGESGRKRRTSEFVPLARAVALAMSQYAQLCMNYQNRLQGVISGDQVEPLNARKIRVAWNGGRESPNRLFVDWGSFAERINHELGTHICITFFPQLKPIE